MRIAIDARLNAYRRGGIPQYTHALLNALAQVAPDEEFVSLQHRDLLRPLAVAPNVRRRTVWTPPHHRFEQWSLPLELLPVRPDVLHCPDFIAPRYRRCPAVVTIHDLAFLRYPEILDTAAQAYYGQIKSSTERADGIIAVSEATRQDIAQFLDVPIEQIAVIYEAAAPMFTRLPLRHDEVRVLNGTPVVAGTFMLFMSTLEPRKNLPTLLRALRICIDRRPDRPYRLVIAGGRGWRDDAIFTTVRDLHLADYVVFAGPVGQYDLRWLYNACRLYANPSLYEGFGLPLLEAMACGAACLASATSSLPEIGGDAAIYVPPLDAGLWADEIEALWDDDDRRDELGRMGMARAQRFSWERAARETLKVYQLAAQGKGREPIYPEHAPTLLPAPIEPPVLAPRQSPDLAQRRCLRCATPLLAGELRNEVALHLSSDAAGEPPLATRLWVCPECGLVELAVDREEQPAAGDAVQASAAEHAAGQPEQPVQPSQAAGDPDEAGAARGANGLAHPAPEHDGTGDQVEGQPVRPAQKRVPRASGRSSRSRRSDR